VASTRRPCVMTLRIAQPGELCAMKQSHSTKIRESMLWNTKQQSGRGFNLAATSALGHVTAALASAAPELLDSTLINKLTDDKRSVVFDGAVRSVRSVTIRYRVQTRWNSSKIISQPNSLRSMCWLTPNIGDLVQREHPQNWG